MEIIRDPEALRGYAAPVPAWLIAAERENVSDCRLSISEEDRFNFLFVVADAGKVRDRVELCGSLNALDKIVC